MTMMMTVVLLEGEAWAASTVYLLPAIPFLVNCDYVRKESCARKRKSM